MGKTKAWVTTHDTVERTMTHDFGSETKIIVDWNFMRILKLKNGELVKSLEMADYTLDKYESLLLETEIEVAG